MAKVFMLLNSILVESRTGAVREFSNDRIGEAFAEAVQRTGVKLTFNFVDEGGHNTTIILQKFGQRGKKWLATGFLKKDGEPEYNVTFPDITQSLRYFAMLDNSKLD